MARRSYGTGSLRMVGGSWYGPDGRRIKRKIGPARTPGERDGLTRPQAEKELRRIRDAEAGTIAAVRVTMAEAGEQLSLSLEVKGRKKSHRLTVASDLRNHIVPFFASKDLGRITPADIERYIAVKRKTLAMKTIRNHLVTIHSAFEIGLRRGWCHHNPVKLADRPVTRSNQTRIRFLDQAELERVLQADYPDDAFARIEPRCTWSPP
jgi:integrase